jgi:hypothetical protein
VKRLVELTIEDLEASPVWRYEGGSGAEALVVPAQRESLSQADDEVFLAATQFELSDSSRHFGFCFPADDSGIDYLQPVILIGSCQVAFWFDRPVAPEVLSEQWRTLGKEPGDIFPVAFQCLVPVDGRVVSGRITSVESSSDLTPSWQAAPIPKAPGLAEWTDAISSSSATADRILTARPVEARRSGAGPIEKRTARRRKAEMTVEFTQGPVHGTGITGDVSHRGMFVRSTQIPGTGPVLHLTVKLPEGRELVLTGRVVRSAETLSSSEPSSGFGIRLATDSPEYAALLARLRKKPG